MRKKTKVYFLVTLLLLLPMIINGFDEGVGSGQVESSQYVYINSQNFPDPLMREYLSEFYDTDGDGRIVADEVDILDFGDAYIGGSFTYEGNEKISNLAGIELFPNLQILVCADSNVTNLDVSQNKKLKNLICNGTGISSLDISGNTELQMLLCEDTDITSLDVSNNKELYYLRVSYDNLTELNITGLEFEMQYDNPYFVDWASGLQLVTHQTDTIDLSRIKGLNDGLIQDYAYDSKTKTVYCNRLYIGEDGPSDLYYFEDSNLPFFIGFVFDDQIWVPSVDVLYSTHVQSIGWQANKVNGEVAGTTSKGKRLEAIKIVQYGRSFDIQYTTHVQSYGWLPWSMNGEVSGTEGESKRLEAIKIQLTGTDADKYNVYYRVHAQSYGWLGWAKNGEPAGTAGYGKRLEAIQILIRRKESGFDQNYKGIVSARKEAYVAAPGSSPVVCSGNTSNQNPVIPGTDQMNVSYRTHVQTYGWQGWKYNGQMSGTSGQAKRLEGINIRLTNNPYDGVICYTTHVQTYGWQGDVNDSSTWKKNGEMAGTSGQGKRLEAIRIKLTDEISYHYDIYYRVHAQSYGWLGWAKNGNPAGTAGYAKRLEGIQIVLVPKGGAAPSNSYGGIVSGRRQAYIAK